MSDDVMRVGLCLQIADDVGLVKSLAECDGKAVHKAITIFLNNLLSQASGLLNAAQKMEPYVDGFIDQLQALDLCKDVISMENKGVYVRMVSQLHQNLLNEEAQYKQESFEQGQYVLEDICRKFTDAASLVYYKSVSLKTIFQRMDNETNVLFKQVYDQYNSEYASQQLRQQINSNVPCLLSDETPKFDYLRVDATAFYDGLILLFKDLCEVTKQEIQKSMQNDQISEESNNVRDGMRGDVYTLKKHFDSTIKSPLARAIQAGDWKSVMRNNVEHKVKLTEEDFHQYKSYLNSSDMNKSCYVDSKVFILLALAVMAYLLALVIRSIRA